MLFAQSKPDNQIHFLANQYNKALVISKNTLCAKSIVEGIQSLLRHVDIATNDGELRWVLNQKHSFQLVTIEAGHLGSLYGLQDAIRSTWPNQWSSPPALSIPDFQTPSEQACGTEN